MFNLTIDGIVSGLRGAYKRIANPPYAPPENKDNRANGFISLSTNDVDEKFLEELEQESRYWRVERKPEGLTSERVSKIGGTIDLKIRNAIKSGTQNKIAPHADWGSYYAHLGEVSVRQDGDYFLRVHQIHGRRF